jgi:protein-S-isoprenylcysteine O-methyltransferase Ste14
MRFLGRTPVRTFIIYPIVTLLWELIVRGDHFSLNLKFLTLLIWGYLQYRLCGRYRKRLGGGGPGLEAPPEKLVTTGLYAYTRNPMYLGHIIFLTGLTLTLQSWLAGVITIAAALWFHSRVLGDEKQLVQVLGAPYANYLTNVKRWIPGLF